MSSKQQLKIRRYLYQHILKNLQQNNLFIASVIVQSNCNISQFSHQMFSLSALLLDDALKLMMPLTNSAINQTLRQFAPLSAPELS